MLVKAHIFICHSLFTPASVGQELYDGFNQVLNKLGLARFVQVFKMTTFDFKEENPVVIFYPGQTFYLNLTPSDLEELCRQHLLNNAVYQEKVFNDAPAFWLDQVASFNLIGFYNRQLRIALRNCGIINPYSIDEYIGRSGYIALAMALKMKQNDIVDLLMKSGLRGRGGGGFPTGLKWRFALNNENTQKYVICNADEGDPGAFMDRSILEGDPHSVLEAMVIAGYTIGASQGYIYIRAEYPSAVERLNHAIKQAYEYKLLGKNILGSDFSFDLEIRLGAGAFVCGEETALIASIEGERGMARNKPPFPAEKGLWGKPTIINNVETFANISAIILNGAEWFSQIGTEKSKGTKVFALGGKIKNTGLIEIPMGTTLREVIFEVGGGIIGNKKFKAVQTGGPSGGCLTEEALDVEIDYDNLVSLGSMMGSGGMIVLDQNNCMVDVARFYLEFTVEESCGKCTPCREGTKRMLEILEKITKGKGELSDLDKLAKLASVIKDASLCGLGQTAPNPVLSTLKHFKADYLAHVVDKTCPSGVCKDLLKYTITDDCVGCGKCKRNCPVQCITGDKKEVHIINQLECIKCGTCMSSCNFHAITLS